MFVDMFCPTLFIACGWTAIPPNGTAARPYRPEMKSGEEEKAERRASRAWSTAARDTWLALGLGALDQGYVHYRNETEHVFPHDLYKTFEADSGHYALD